jgi:hypothetical protein
MWKEAHFGSKSDVAWDVMQRTRVEVHKRFGGTYCLCIQDRRNAKQAMSKKQEARRGNPCSLRTLCIFDQAVNFTETP